MRITKLVLAMALVSFTFSNHSYAAKGGVSATVNHGQRAAMVNKGQQSALVSHGLNKGGVTKGPGQANKK